MTDAHARPAAGWRAGAVDVVATSASMSNWFDETSSRTNDI